MFICVFCFCLHWLKDSSEATLLYKKVRDITSPTFKPKTFNYSSF